MRLNFLSWQRHTKPTVLLQIAIIKTLVDKIIVTVAELQKILPRKANGSYNVKRYKIHYALK